MPSLDSTIALVALADVKDYLKVTDTSQDTILTYFINEVSRFINTYCGRQLVQKSYTEYYDGDGTDELLLKHYPIITLTSVYDDSLRTWAAATQVPAADILTYKDEGRIRVWNNTGSFSKGKANIRVIYDAGYAAASVPYDLQLAAKRLIAGQWMRQQHKQHDILTTSVRDQTTTFQITDLPPIVKAVLSEYRRRDRKTNVLE